MNIILTTINRLFNLLELVIIVRIVFSYIPSLRGNAIYEVVYQLTEPILAPIRELLYKIGLNRGMIDFSPIFAFLLISLIRGFLFSVLR